MFAALILKTKQLELIHYVTSRYSNL